MRKLSFKMAFVAVAAMGLILTSCNTTIEVAKRQHRKGYHVSISNNKTEKGQVSETVAKSEIKAEKIELAVVDSPAVDSSKVEKLYPSAFETVVASVDTPAVDSSKTEDKVFSSMKKMTIAQKVKTVKQVRKQLKQMKKQGGFTAAGDDDWEIDSDVMFVVMIILAIILPPLAVYLIKGKSTSFILNLLLLLVGIGVGYALLGGLVWWAGLLALIHAILVVLGHS